jgi:hypothetical protein
MRVLTPRYVDHLELARYLRGLVNSGRWKTVHAIPHADPRYSYLHLFDVYGQPA